MLLAHAGRHLELDGSVRLFGVVGDPIAQVKSPGGITAQFLLRGANALLVPLHVPPDGFPQFMAAAREIRNLAGLVITVPHKIAVVPHLASLTPRARFLGAANIIRRIAPDGGWHGDLSDGEGMLHALTAAGFSPQGKRILLAGAGGAGSAIALALLEAGAAELAVHDTNTDRRDSLLARLREHSGARLAVGSPDPAGFDLAVNATPMGMRPVGMRPEDPLPLDAARLAPGAWAADVVTMPARTPFLEAATARGCATVPGTAMFAAQAGYVADFLLAEP
jgi:shikimate dehydrogenase